MARVTSIPRIGTAGEAFLARADPPGRRYKANPVLWARERVNVELWSKQQEIIQSVRDNRKTAVHSCHETGKSFVAATTVAWWLDVHEPGEAFVVTTAPTAPQVEAILWREINRLHQTGHLPGRTNLTEWYIGRELVAFGRKPSDYNPHAFQGIHARYFLVVLDEACGVVPIMWTAASTLAANEHSRTLAIGNPDDINTEFGDNCREGTDWNVIKIGYADTPNFTGESVKQHVADSLIHPVWVDDRAAKWGRESALFQSKCLGIFPTVGDPFATIPYSWANACRYHELPARGDVEAGVDVGGGGDRTVVTIRQGPRFLHQEVFVDADPMRSVGRVASLLKERDVRRVKVDTVGIGWAFSGRLKELSSRGNPYGSGWTHDAEVIGINFAENPPIGTEEKYLNMRAYAHWEVGRENSRLKQWDLSLLNDDTIHELTVPRYKIIDSNGKIQIERKDEIIKRTGHSPDLSDSLLLAFIETTFEVKKPEPESMAGNLLQNMRPRDTLGPRPF